MITLGIIGHRDISAKKIHLYKQNVLKLLKKLRTKHKKLKIVTPLADGADRLVVTQGLRLGIDFDGILPMKKNEYKKDFTYFSKKEFDKLLKKSDSIMTLVHHTNISRNSKYEAVGKYISDRCDIVLALWDGKYNHLQGGTSETVKYHLLKNKQLIHIKVARNGI